LIENRTALFIPINHVALIILFVINNSFFIDCFNFDFSKLT